jgi:hypothetical protein
VITDDLMRERLAKAREYTLVLLSATAERETEGADELVWEHGRRNFELREEGRLAIVCPVADDSELAGIGIFTGTPEEVAGLMDEDPAVKAGLFTYEVHPVRGFPGDGLPG